MSIDLSQATGRVFCVPFVLCSAERLQQLTSTQRVVHVCRPAEDDLRAGKLFEQQFQKSEHWKQWGGHQEKKKKEKKDPANHLKDEVAWPRMQRLGRSFVLVTRGLWGLLQMIFFFFLNRIGCVRAYVADAGFIFQTGLCSLTLLVWPHGGYLKNWFAASQHGDQLLDNTGNCLACCSATRT